MALLGVILLLLGAGAGVIAYLATRGAAGTVTVAAFGLSRAATPLELVIYGAVAVLLFALGWALVSAATRRRMRLRREDKETARLTEAEQNAEEARRNHERELAESGLRNEDLSRRENELAARHEGLDTRESELARREAEWREREATAGWTDDTHATGGVERPAETRTGRRADRLDPTDERDSTV
jgi:membrane protein implicated in regulation of membrane protease activity